MAPGTRSQSKKKAITAEDLHRLHLLTSLSMAPDESRIAYTLEWVDPEKKKYFTNIHLLDIAAGAKKTPAGAQYHGLQFGVAVAELCRLLQLARHQRVEPVGGIRAIQFDFRHKVRRGYYSTSWRW